MSKTSLALLLLLASTAHAASDEIDNLCLTMGESMAKVARARDGGVSLEDARAIVNRSFASMPKARPIVENMVRKIYLADEMSPNAVAREMYNACISVWGTK